MSTKPKSDTGLGDKGYVLLLECGLLLILVPARDKRSPPSSPENTLLGDVVCDLFSKDGLLAFKIVIGAFLIPNEHL